MSDELNDAMWDGDFDAIYRLIAAGADPNAPDEDGVLPLVCAAGHGIAMFRALLDAGARHDPEVLALCLNYACQHRDDMAMVEHLLELGADVGALALGETALHAAVSNGGDLAVLDRLLAAGATVDVRDRRGRTPFQHAATFRYITVLERLVQAGADVHAVDFEGATALDLVIRRDAIAYPDEFPVRQDELDTAAWLRKAMADTSVMGPDGDAPRMAGQE